MQLQFLGRPYPSTADSIDTPPLNISGAYRGNQVSFRSAQIKPIQSATALHYRGIAYLH
ncbi:MAG: DUF4278 domain-containing protein [Cyanobacteria bacterium P01_A01_bin.37]